jgi:hypothetical protein
MQVYRLKPGMHQADLLHNESSLYLNHQHRLRFEFRQLHLRHRHRRCSLFRYTRPCELNLNGCLQNRLRPSRLLFPHCCMLR